MKNLTATTLKTALWETLNDLKNGKVEVNQANAIATQSREILRAVNTQLKISSQSGRDIATTAIDFAEK